MNFERLFVEDAPLIDVRAPVEFLAGHFPHSVNLPLLNDDERAAVGTAFKKQGRDSAIALGYDLISGNKKSERIQAWLSFLEKKPQAKLYCFRGGLRSKISGEWIRGRGQPVDVIPGGYKALRQFLISRFEELCARQKFILVGGQTGVAKSVFLYRQPLSFIDLEKLAGHRGSSFGSLGNQPAQVTFENTLAIELMKLSGPPVVLLEDEPYLIGKCNLTKVFFDKIRSGPMIILEKSLEARVEHIAEEYVLSPLREGTTAEELLTKLAGSLFRISKKLGGTRFQSIKGLMETAFNSGERVISSPHREWVKELLVNYYDPLYEKSLSRRSETIVFRGEENDCRNYLQTYRK